MRLDLSPDSLISAPFNVKVSGLEPGAPVLVWAETTDRHGEVWAAEADYRADGNGHLDLTQHPAPGGDGVADPFLPLWGLRPRTALCPAFFESPDDGYDLGVSVHCAGQTRRGDTRRLLRLPGVTEQPVRAGGLLGTLLTPAQSLRGACLCLGGSEGGLHGEVAGLLASEGFLVLNLAYFGLPGSGLPTDLLNIPLDYFGRALAWLRAHPQVAGRTVGVTGASKGGEAALLIGATYPEDTGAVAAVAPSGLVFEGILRGGRQGPEGRVSSWSLSGQPLPYVPVRCDWGAFFAGPGPYSLTPIHARALDEVSLGELEAATIPVERIRGPVLLVSGGADRTWPSTRLSFIAQVRREAAGLPVTHLTHPQAGHALSLPNLPAWTRLPGSEPGDDAADARLRREAWHARVEVLASVWADQG